MPFKRTLYTDPSRLPPSVEQSMLLSISDTGRIHLNKHFVKKHGIKPGMRVRLYWDDEQSSMASIFTSQPASGSYPLVRNPDGQTMRIAATQFFRSVRLDPTKYTGVYTARQTKPSKLGIEGEAGDAYVINLR